MILSDAEIVARAIENGWEMTSESNDFAPDRGYWRRGGVGYPFGTFRGPQWEDVDGKRVKVSDEPTYTKTAADVMRSALDDHDDRCGECGRWIEYGHFVGYERKRAPLPYCWNCKHWLERVAVRDESNRFVALSRGLPNVYSIGTRKTPSSHNGFGGAWWVVEFYDGRVVETCDLWAGSAVPERFRDRLPITATLRSGRIGR